MPIRVRCQCGQKLKAPDTFAGRRVLCPACKAKVRIPRPGPASDDPTTPELPLCGPLPPTAIGEEPPASADEGPIGPESSPPSEEWPDGPPASPIAAEVAPDDPDFAPGGPPTPDGPIEAPGIRDREVPGPPQWPDADGAMGDPAAMADDMTPDPMPLTWGAGPAPIERPRPEMPPPDDLDDPWDPRPSSSWAAPPAAPIPAAEADEPGPPPLVSEPDGLVEASVPETVVPIGPTSAEAPPVPEADEPAPVPVDEPYPVDGPAPGPIEAADLPGVEFGHVSTSSPGSTIVEAFPLLPAPLAPEAEEARPETAPPEGAPPDPEGPTRSDPTLSMPSGPSGAPDPEGPTRFDPAIATIPPPPEYDEVETTFPVAEATPPEDSSPEGPGPTLTATPEAEPPPPAVEPDAPTTRGPSVDLSTVMEWGDASPWETDETAVSPIPPVTEPDPEAEPPVGPGPEPGPPGDDGPPPAFASHRPEEPSGTVVGLPGLEASGWQVPGPVAEVEPVGQAPETDETAFHFPPLVVEPEPDSGPEPEPGPDARSEAAVGWSPGWTAEWEVEDPPASGGDDNDDPRTVGPVVAPWARPAVPSEARPAAPAEPARPPDRPSSGGPTEEFASIYREELRVSPPRPRAPQPPPVRPAATPSKPPIPARPGPERRAVAGGAARRRRSIVAVMLGLGSCLAGAAVVFGLLRGDGGSPADDGDSPPAAAVTPGRQRPRAASAAGSISLAPAPPAEPARFAGPPEPRPATADGLIGPNLVLNPGAERSTAPDAEAPGPADFDGWERLGGVSIGSYGSRPVDPAAVAEAPDLGRSYFLGGLPASRSDGRTLLRQAVDVSALADRIDADRLRFDASAWLGGLDQTRSFAPNDAATLTVRFLDASRSELPDSAVVLGPIDDGLLQSGPPDTHRIALVSRSGPVPGGTRAIAFELSFDRRAGEAIDASADGLQFVLREDWPQGG